MTKKIIFSLLLALASAGIQAKDYKAVMFGVMCDGVTDNTRSLQRAIDQIAAEGGGKLSLYVGRYLTGSIRLRDGVVLSLGEGTVLVASPSVYDQQTATGAPALIWADGAKGCAVTGKGILEGNARLTREDIERQTALGHVSGVETPVLVSLKGCTGARVEGLTLQDACGTLISVDGSKDTTLKGLTLRPGTAPAIALKGADGLTATGCYMDCEAGQAVSGQEGSQHVTLTDCMTPSGKKL